MIRECGFGSKLKAYVNLSPCLFWFDKSYSAYQYDNKNVHLFLEIITVIYISNVY
jgi:hypothetical protein